MKTYALKKRGNCAIGINPYPRINVLNRRRAGMVRKILDPLRLQAKLNVSDPKDACKQEACPVADVVRGMPDEALQRQPLEEEKEKLQAKLSIGQPDDKYEQEADRVADHVMAMPDPKIQRQPENEEEEILQPKLLVDQVTPLVQRHEEPAEEGEKVGQAKSLANKPAPVSNGLQSRIQSLKGGGQSLPASGRAFFEPRFGRDFSNVRVHSDNRAARIAKSINARAFTLGRDVVFGAGQYSPNSHSGRSLIAHELTHVVQQNNTQAIQRDNDKDKISTSTPSASTIVKINALFVSRMTWLNNTLRDEAGAAFDKLKSMHGKLDWKQKVAAFFLSTAMVGLGAVVGSLSVGVGVGIFSAILHSAVSSMLSSSIKSQNLNISDFKKAVKEYINDYIFGPNIGVVDRLKDTNSKDKLELKKVLSLLSMKKKPQIKKIAQELAMSTFLAASKGFLIISYRAVGPDLSKYSGDLSRNPFRWFKPPGRHVNFHVPGLRSVLASSGYTKGMHYLESIYQGKKVKDSKIPVIVIGVGIRFPQKGKHNYYYCDKHFSKRGNVKGCSMAGPIVGNKFYYIGGKIMVDKSFFQKPFGYGKIPITNDPKSVVDKPWFDSDSWYNYYLKSDVADKALAYALNETLPKPRP